MILNSKLAHHLKFKSRSSLKSNPFLYILKSPLSGVVSDGYRNAEDVFDEILQPDSKICNAYITACCKNGNYREALSLFCRMQQVGLRPDHHSLPPLLKSCAALWAIELGKAFHGCVVKEGYEFDVAICKAMINMYAKSGGLNDSRCLFDEMGHRDTVMWNIIISGYAQLHLEMEAVGLFYSMHVCEEEPKPNAITVATVLPVCARLKALKCGKSIHAYVVKCGFESETLVGNALVSMYAKCSSVWDDAYVVFNQMACLDTVSWNAVIAGCAENGLLAEALGLFSQMLLADFKPNYATIATVLPICAYLEDGRYGKEIHGYILRSSLNNNVSVCNALIIFYSRIGRIEEAEFVFRSSCCKDLVSWNTVIAGYAMNGWIFEALDLFHELLSMEMRPDSVTLISVLPVCGELADVKEGKKIHEYVIRQPELCDDTTVGNALISFYAKCGELEEAIQTFQSMQKRDLISWNAMLAAYAESGHGENVVRHLYRMQKEGIIPDSVTILSILRLSSILSMMAVKEIHAYSIRVGIINELTVGNAILDAYAKCGSIDYAFKNFQSLSGKNVVTGNAMIAGYVNHGRCLEDAEMIFDQMQDRDLTTWNLMIQVYGQNDCADQALNLICELQCQGMRPDVMTLMSILPVCTHLVSLHQLRQCHGYAVRACFYDVCLEGALLDAYSKCGSINDAHKLFRMSPQKDLVMFTAMICGYAMHGMGKEALAVFSQMLEFNMKPDHVIMTAVLSACSHAGLVDEGWMQFSSMSDAHGVKPTMEHYSCMVDLLARAGRLQDAHDFITNMPVQANANVWGTLLGACKIHNEVGLGQMAANHLFNIESRNIGNYVVLSNIYAADCRWDGVEEMRRLMKTKELKKPAGCSWIEVERRQHVFVAADLSHPQRPIIYSTLRTLDRQIKEHLV